MEPRLTPSIVFQPHFGPEGQWQGSSGGLNWEQVHVLFWGPQSGKGAWTNSQMQSYYTAVKDLLAGSFYSGQGGISQYRNGNNPSLTLDPNYYVDNNGPPQTMNTDACQGQVERGFGMNYSFSDIYVVAVSTAYPSMGSNIAGENWVDDGGITNNDDGDAFVNERVNMIYVGNTGSVDGFGFTWTLSHELAEELTSPNGTGFMVNANPNWPNKNNIPTTGQIGDYEANSYDYRQPDGVQVQPFWSQQGQDFVVPDNFATNQITVIPNYSGNSFQGNYQVSARRRPSWTQRQCRHRDRDHQLKFRHQQQGGLCHDQRGNRPIRYRRTHPDHGQSCQRQQHGYAQRPAGQRQPGHHERRSPDAQVRHQLGRAGIHESQSPRGRPDHPGHVRGGK